MYLTPSEIERQAFIEGRHQTATIADELDQAEQAISEAEDMVEVVGRLLEDCLQTKPINKEARALIAEALEYIE